MIDLKKFEAFTEQFEGRIAWMYQDILGLMTTGIGYLIEPMSVALKLPWLKIDDEPAEQQEIATEWMRMKADKTLAKAGAQRSKKLATLHLSDQAISLLCAERASQMITAIKRYSPYAAYDDWPDEIQMAVLSMSWAIGPSKLYFAFPKFRQACFERNWQRCADECKIDETDNPGIVPRNVTNRTLFLQAAVAASGHEAT